MGSKWLAFKESEPPGLDPREAGPNAGDDQHRAQQELDGFQAARGIREGLEDNLLDHDGKGKDSDDEERQNQGRKELVPALEDLQEPGLRGHALNRTGGPGLRLASQDCGGR